MRGAVLTKGRVRRWLERNFFLRIHMTLILGGTILAGLAATTLLLEFGVTSLPLRYVLSVFAAYLVFLVLIRLWLFYVRGGDDFALDLASDGIEIAGELTVPDDPLPGGGNFGGGGTTGSWNEPTVAAPLKSSAASSSSSSSSSGSGFGFDFDLDGLVVVVLFFALVFSLLFIGIYAIYTAPALLSEAAFEAILAGALARRARKIDRPGWVGAVWRATFWPFLLVLLLAGGLGWAAENACPDATRVQDVFDCESASAGASPRSRG